MPKSKAVVVLHRAGSRPLPVSVCPRLPLPLRRLLFLARLCPPSPAVVVAATATDGGGRAWQIVAVCRRPSCRGIFCCRVNIHSGSRSPPPTPNTTTTEIVFLLRDLNCAAGRRRRRQPPSSGDHCRCFLSAADTLVISCNLVDCCDSHLFSMFRCDGRHHWESCSNKDRRHRHLQSRRRLPPRGTPGSLGGGGLFNCWGRDEPSNVSSGGMLGPPSPQRRRQLGSWDDDRWNKLSRQ